MRDFHSWVGSRAGTIVDTSVIHKKCTCGALAPKYESLPVLTPLQQRAAFADLLVPVVNNENTLCDWITALCASIVGTIGNCKVAELSLRDLIGDRATDEYFHTDGDKESLRWYGSARINIAAGVEL